MVKVSLLQLDGVELPERVKAATSAGGTSGRGCNRSDAGPETTSQSRSSTASRRPSGDEEITLTGRSSQYIAVGSATSQTRTNDSVPSPVGVIVTRRRPSGHQNGTLQSGKSTIFCRASTSQMWIVLVILESASRASTRRARTASNRPSGENALCASSLKYRSATTTPSIRPRETRRRGRRAGPRPAWREWRTPTKNHEW